MRWDNDETDNKETLLQLNQVVKVPDDITLYKNYMLIW